MKYSHFYKVKRNPSISYHLLIQKKTDGNPLYFLFSDMELTAAAARAGKEYECIPADAVRPECCDEYSKYFIVFTLVCGILSGIFIGMML